VKDAAVTPPDRPTARPEVELHLLPDGSGLLFDPVSEEGHVLDPIGALAWDYCDGTLTADEIAGEVAALVPTAPRLREDVRDLLAEFARRGLLAGPTPAGPPE